MMPTFMYADNQTAYSDPDLVVGISRLARTVSIRHRGDEQSNGSNLNVFLVDALGGEDTGSAGAPIPLEYEGNPNTSARDRVEFILPAGCEVWISRGMGSALYEVLVTGA